MSGSGGLVDSTLREGLQAPGVRLDGDQSAEVVDHLCRIGIEEVEIGPALGEGHCGRQAQRRLVRRIRAEHPSVRLAVWCRALAVDVSTACALRPDLVTFALPVSDLHLRTRLRRSPAWAVQHLSVLADHARRQGARQVCVGLEDATRADPDVLERVLAAARRARVDRVRLADTIGVATPADIAALVARSAAVFDQQIAVHAHNDFGQATANALAALDAGAHWADVSLLGLGERAGIARTEEVAAFLALRRGRPYATQALAPACRRLAQWLQRPIAPDHPVAGDLIFTCESGVHLHGLDADPRTYQPYPPDRIGAQQQVRLGLAVGRAAVASQLRGRLHAAEGALASLDLDRLTDEVRQEAVRRGRSLTTGEVVDLARTRIDHR